MGVFLLFVLAVSLGSLTTLYWIPEGDLGRGYFQMNALVVLGLLGLAMAVVLLHPFCPFGDRPAAGLAALSAALAGGFLYYAAIWRERWALGRWPLTLSLAGCLAALLLAGPHVVAPLTPLPGHWYLVAPRLTFRHLTVFSWVLLGTVVLRLLSVAASLTVAARVNELVEPHPLRVLAGFGGQGIFFWFRVLWGLVIVLPLTAMALHCARQRSNQSATGILYVVVVGAFIGEITAYYLSVTTGVPI
jgi:hypothetical protein